MPVILFAQDTKKEEKRLSILVGTSQGISFMHKEAKSNTYKKTFESSFGYAFSYGAGISVASKNRKAFSEIIIKYNSYSNGIKGIVDVSSKSGYSDKTSYDRFNYLTLDYRYSRYVKTISDYNTFFSVGIQASYIWNEKKSLKYEKSNEIIRTKGGNFSNNFVILSSPTFLISYGAEFNKGIMNIGKKSRLSLDITYDTFAFGLMSSPSNQYSSMLINYRILF